MAAEEGFDFNTTGTVKQVQLLENALDQLLLMVQKVDKGNLKGLAKEFQQLSTVGVGRVKELAEKAQEELNKIGKIKITTDLSGLKTGLLEMEGKKAALKNLKDLMQEAQAYLKTEKLTLQLDSQKIYGQLSSVEKEIDRIRNKQAAANAIFAAALVPAPVAMNMPSKDMFLQSQRNQPQMTLPSKDSYLQAAAAAKLLTEQQLRLTNLQKELTAEVTKARPRFNDLSDGMDRLHVSSAGLHSGLRGVASGFNAMWLTYGQVMPLLIGAGFSNSIVQVTKLGSSVANTMAIIEVLGGNSKAEMSGLADEMVRLGTTGSAGPLEIAEAMKILSLAGMKANEILGVTQTVLNFSVAGTTDLKTAADTLISVSTAFGMGAEGFTRVADVIAKASAESKTSVESFSNAMKTASVINKQYGVSLVDTATQIAALSQLGIEGTAAGTAVRNMYADLSGRSKQVAAVLKSQGLEMRNATGEFKPMIAVVGELQAKLQGMTGISKQNFLSALLSERGAKGMIELLQLITAQAKDMGSGLANALVESRDKIEKSYGFVAISGAKLSQTVEKQFEALKATLGTTMNSVYQELEPKLLLVMDRLKQTFNSPEFIAGLSSLVGFVGQLGSSLVTLGAFLVEHSTAVALVSAAYIGLRYAMTLAAAQAATTSTAMVAASTASRAATAGQAAGLLGLARIIPGIGQAVGLLSLAWVAYDYIRNKATDTDKAAADLYTNNIVKTLEDQTFKLRELNRLRATGLTLTEAQARVDADRSIKDQSKAGSASYEALVTKSTKAWDMYNQAAMSEAGKSAIGAARMAGLKREAQDASAAVRDAAAQETARTSKINKAAAENAEEQKKFDAAQAADMAKRQKELAALQGTNTFTMPGSKGTAKTDLEKEQDRVQNQAEAILRTSQQYKEVAAQEAASIATLTAVEKARIKTLSDIKMLTEGKTKPSKEAADMLAEAARNADAAVISDTKQAQDKLYQASVKETKKLLDAAAASSRDFWRKDTDAAEKLEAVNAMNIAIKTMSEREVAVYKARVDATADYDKGVQGLTSELEKASEAHASFMATGGLIANPAVLDDLNSRMTKLQELIDEYERVAGRKVEGRATAAGTAYDASAAAKANGSYSDAATSAMRAYLKNNEDVAGQTEKVFTTAYSNMEDSLVKFVTTGKLSFRSLVDSVIEGLVRIAIQSATSGIFNSILGLAGSVAGGTFGMDAAGLQSSGAVTSGVSGWGAGAASGAALPHLAVGTDYVPYDMIAKIHKGERITPAASNPYANPYTKEKAETGQSITVVQNFTVGDVASISTVREAVANSEKRMAAIVQRSKVYGGAYA